MVTRLYSCQTWLKNVTAVAANLWANTETRDLIWPLNIWTGELPEKIRWANLDIALTSTTLSFFEESVCILNK